MRHPFLFVFFKES